MAGWSSVGFLSGLKKLPTLMLMGEQDGVMPACYGQMLAEQIDGAVLEVVPGSHLFPFTHAAAISARISAFLDQSAPAQAAA
jgi:pimeloyl-ACP methyl ester carboxylesterase